MTTDNFGTTIDIPDNKSTVAVAEIADVPTEDTEVDSGMKLGGSGFNGGVTVDDLGLAVNVPGDRISLEVIELDEIPDM